MKVLSRLIAVAVVAGVASAASAQVTSFSVTSNTSADPSGYVVNDLFLSFNGQLNANQVLTSGLQAGDIYQDVFGSDTAPSTAAVDSSSSLANDTFVQYGDTVSDSPESVTASFAGGAVDLGGSSTMTFDDQKLNAAYFPPGGTAITDQSNYFIGRITLKDTANGSVEFLHTAELQDSNHSFDIINGQIVPEPASASVLGLGALALLRRRR